MATACEKFLQKITGTWEGNGAGEYPTMDPFSFEARAKFHRIPEKTKAFFLNTSVESWRPQKKGELGMHFDSGFLKCISGTELEWGLAHNFGGTEALKGVVNADGTRAEFHSTAFGNVTYLKETARFIDIDSSHGTMTDVFHMASGDVPLTKHLTIAYKRAASSGL